MENKLNYKAIEDYCGKYATIISDQWFASHETINGKEILSVTPSKQVNLFIIKNLFFEWKEEAERLKSDYFNYKADSVKDALQTLMNELSQNILIEKEAFTPLLMRSIENALLLILSPYDFYEKEVNNPDRSKLRLSYLRDLKKYIKINGNLLDAIIGGFEKEDIKKASKEESFKIFQEAFNQFEGEPADITEYVSDFSKILPLDLDNIYHDTHGQNLKPESNGDDEKSSSESQDQNDRKTLNDTFQEVDKTTLADELQYSKIENLKDSMSVNQKFMFINKLFAGDSGIFHEALNKIETLGSKDDAVNLLELDYTVYREWDHESEEVIEFMELLERRFK